MQFVYHKEAKNSTLLITGETYAHLFKSRRKKATDFLHVRNLQDDNLYTYSVSSIDRKSATLELESFKYVPKKPLHNFTLGWSVVDPKIIEKTLPCLNEIGVSSIAFVYSDFSQKNFKLDTKRATKILINSCEQCGRSSLVEFHFFNSVKEYLQEYPHSFIADFGHQNLDNFKKPHTVLVGCEGGFSQEERSLFQKEKIITLDSPFILKSQSAACAIASKILL